MILGIGSDLIDIRRIESGIARFGNRFLDRLFTPEERAACKARAPAYAKRFAAKEACAKALGTGIAQGVGWRDMGIATLPGGKPVLILTGGAARRLAEITPPGMTAQIDVSLADDYPLAQAFVVLSAVALANPAGPA